MRRSRPAGRAEDISTRGQPVRLQIAGTQAVGHFEHHRQRGFALLQRLRQFAPRRPGECKDRQRRSQQRQQQWRAAAATAALQLVRQQVRIDHAGPAAAGLAHVAPQPRQCRQREQRQQPLRTQEVERRKVHQPRPTARVRNSGSTSASAAASSAAASGHAYSSLRGRSGSAACAAGSRRSSSA